MAVRRVKKSKTHDNGYLPDDLLVNYMRQKLQFERDKEKSKLRGKELAENETYSNLKKRKFDVLDRVFRSLANLIFFFKCIAEYPELEKVFEDDVMDLLGIKRNDPQKQDLGFVFYDLLDYILIGKKGGRYGEGPDDRLDFRLILNHIVQKIVCYKMRQSSVGILDMEGPRNVVMGDFHKVWAWTEMLLHIAEQNLDDKVPPNRTFDFRDRDLSNE